MPGMMETVLNIGLNDAVGEGPGRAVRRRAVRLGLLPAAAADVRQDGARRSTASCSRTRWTSAKPAKGVATDVDLDADDLQELVETFKDIVVEHAGPRVPAGPARAARHGRSRAVFDSWNTDRARLYRRRERIPHDLGTAVNICTMVFGNLGDDSGTGVAFTRDPATGQHGRLRRLPGQRAGRGRRRRHPQHPAARRPRADRPGVVRRS